MSSIAASPISRGGRGNGGSHRSASGYDGELDRRGTQPKGVALGKIRISADGGSGASAFVTPERAIGPPLLAARQAWFVRET